MKLSRLLLKGLVCAIVTAGAAMAGPAEIPGRVIGQVLASDAAARRLTIKTDQGDEVTVSVLANAPYLRVPPGEKDLKRASRIGPGDVAAGDRILARGRLGANGGTMEATAVIVMSRADLEQKRQHDRDEWQRRGTAGAIAALDGGAHRFTLASGTPADSPPLVVETSPRTEFLRYAPDSVRFSDARPSTFAALGVGDRVRVLGNRSPDGTGIQAEEIVSGAFRSIAATVDAVNAAAGELRVTDLATHKQITVRVSSASTLRRLTPMAAAMLARRFNSGAHPMGDPRQMLARMPVLALEELKPGDALIISGGRGADSASLTAITLVAGVEPLLRTAPPRQVGGAWNFGDIGLPQE